MQVSYEIVGPIAHKPQANPGAVELPAGGRVVDLMRLLGYTETEARHLTYLRGSERLLLLAPLTDGDRISAVLHVGGG